MSERVTVILVVLVAAGGLTGCRGDRKLASTLRDEDWACASARAVFGGERSDASIIAAAVRNGAAPAQARDLVARARRVSRDELDRKLAVFCVPRQGMGGG